MLLTLHIHSFGSKEMHFSIHRIVKLKKHKLKTKECRIKSNLTANIPVVIDIPLVSNELVFGIIWFQ